MLKDELILGKDDKEATEVCLGISFALQSMNKLLLGVIFQKRLAEDSLVEVTNGSGGGRCHEKFNGWF